MSREVAVGNQEARTDACPMGNGLVGLLALLMVASFTTAVEAQQTGRITGTVTDAQSGAPLGQVQVYLAGTELGTLTQSSGGYLILNVAPGTYQVSARRLGFGTTSQSVTVGTGETVWLDFALETEALGLDEIVVTGTAGSARRRDRKSVV